jgi:hypothetical protein
MSGRGPKLKFSVARGPQLQQPVVAAIVQLEARDRLRVAPIEPFCQPQHRCQMPNRAAALLLEVAVVLMAAFRRRLTMVASDQRDDFHFLGIEAPQITILDQIVRVFVVAFIADVDAAVVEDARVFEPFALVIGHAVDASRLVEQHRREARDLLRMFGPVIASFGEFEDAAPADVRIAIGLRDLLAMPRDVVEDEAFAQGQVAQCHVGGAKAAHERVEQDAARHREIRASRFEARHPEAFFQIAADQLLLDAADLLRRDSAVAERRRLAAFGERHRADALNRPRRADDAIESQLDDLAEEFSRLVLDETRQLALITRRERIALDEPFCQTNDAELEALSGFHRQAGAAGDFDTSAADVDDDADLA